MKSSMAVERTISDAGAVPSTQLSQDSREVSAIAEMAGAVTAALRPRALLKLLALRAARACGVERCSIFVCRGEAVIPAMAQLASGHSEPDDWAAFRALGPYTVRDGGPVARAIATRDLVLVENARKVLPRAWVDRFSPATVLLAPLFRRRRPVGVMVLDNRSSTPITEAQIARARAIAGAVGAAVGRALAMAETRRRLRASETLLTVGHTIGSTLELTEVARRITREAARALSADSAAIYLADDSGTSLQPLAAYHMPRRLLETIQKEAIVLRDVPNIFSGTRWSDDVPNDPRFAHEIFKKFPLQSIVTAPLPGKERAVGILVCAWWTKRRRLSREEVRVVEGISAHAAMAIVNANLYGQAEELAVNRERMRMTHELHDTLSRVLFSIALKVDWCLQRLPGGSDLKPHVEEIKQEARAMMAHLRRAIQQLASADDGAGGLARLVREFQDLSGIPVLFVEHGDLSRLDERRRELLERTIREALANVIKHARARRVELRVDLAADMVEFEVADDGVGVCSDGEEGAGVWGHYGIRQMRDQLTAAGGDLELHANVPSGLRLKGRFPGR